MPGINARVGTALILAPLALAITLYGSNGLFAGLCAAAVLAGAWEWGNLTGPRPIGWKIGALVLTALLLIVCYSNIDSVMSQYIAVFSLFWWGVALILIMRQQRGRQFRPGPLLQAGIGLVVLAPAWVSVVALHAQFRGPALAACLFVLIWAADTGAYYVGRRWGRNKLAIHVSPGKTLEGLFGALGFGLLAALSCALLLQMSGREAALFLLICLITIAMSVVGDLTESMLKRSGGVKDSGDLLPGHGGALDRIDSLTAAAPVFFTGVLLLEGAT